MLNTKLSDRILAISRLPDSDRYGVFIHYQEENPNFKHILGNYETSEDAGQAVLHLKALFARLEKSALSQQEAATIVPVLFAIVTFDSLVGLRLVTRDSKGCYRSIY
jgi:hypothetical protein